jgi:hypothetical protein
VPSVHSFFFELLRWLGPIQEINYSNDLIFHQHFLLKRTPYSFWSPQYPYCNWWKLANYFHLKLQIEAITFYLCHTDIQSFHFDKENMRRTCLLLKCLDLICKLSLALSYCKIAYLISRIWSVQVQKNNQAHWRKHLIYKEQRVCLPCSIFKFIFIIIIIAK